MKTYTLKGKGKQPDISFTVEDLIPLPQKLTCQFEELLDLVSHAHFHPSDQDFAEDYKFLYQKEENKKSDFFLIINTAIVTIPGGMIHPTDLTPSDVESDHLRKRFYFK